MLATVFVSIGENASRAMFRPLNEGDAIREAAFAILPKLPIEPALVSGISSNLQVPWRDYAPKRSDVRAVFFGAPPGVPTALDFAPNGVEYQGFNAKGERIWRIAVDPQSIVVNCLQYPGWNTAWPMIRAWFEWIVSQLPSSSFEASGFMLQYINAFPWEGDIKDCRPSHLLRADSDRIAPLLYTYPDSRWHQNTGRFEQGCDPYEGETLVRVQAAGNRLPGDSSGFKYEAIVDVLVHAFPGSPVDLKTDLSEEGSIFMLYENLHDLIKCELSSYLDDRLVEAVRLHG
jgi:uncharacterized protein (TIGR04255 family)